MPAHLNPHALWQHKACGPGGSVSGTASWCHGLCVSWQQQQQQQHHTQRLVAATAVGGPGSAALSGPHHHAVTDKCLPTSIRMLCGNTRHAGLVGVCLEQPLSAAVSV